MITPMTYYQDTKKTHVAVVDPAATEVEPVAVVPEEPEAEVDSSTALFKQL